MKHKLSMPLIRNYEQNNQQIETKLNRMKIVYVLFRKKLFQQNSFDHLNEFNKHINYKDIYFIKNTKIE